MIEYSVESISEAASESWVFIKGVYDHLIVQMDHGVAPFSYMIMETFRVDDIMSKLKILQV